MTKLWVPVAFLVPFFVSFLLLRYTQKANILMAKENRNMQIDGLRGFLAFSVFLHHSIITRAFNETGLWQAPISNIYNQLGQTAVALFFMITGFLFFGKLIEQKSKFDYVNLYLNRIFRLYPIYIIVIIVVIIGSFASMGLAFNRSLLKSIYDIANWIVFKAHPIDGYAHSSLIVAGVTWTLPYEISFYLALPIIGFILDWKTNRSALIVSIFSLIACVILYRFNLHALRYALLFLGGMLGTLASRNTKIQKVAKTWYMSVIAIILLALEMILFHDPYKLFPTIMLTMVFCIIASGNSVFSLLNAKPIRWMGEISYSTYITHGILLWIVMERLPKTYSPLQYVIMNILVAIVLVLLNSATYLYVEVPGIGYGKYLAKVFLRKRIAVETNLHSS